MAYKRITVLLLCLATRNMEAAQLSITDVGSYLWDTFVNPTTSNSEGQVYKCPDYNFASDAVNDFRAAYGLGPLLWDDQLVEAARQALLSQDGMCDGSAWLDTNGSNVFVGIAYLAANRESSYKCVQAINYWYFLGLDIDSNPNFRGGFDVTDQNANLTMFAALMWMAATKVGCALKDCASGDLKQKYAVVCHVGEVPEISSGKVSADAIKQNVPGRQQSDNEAWCPRAIITNRKDSLKMIQESNGDLLSEDDINRIICYHDQFSRVDVKQHSVPLVIPCRGADVPATCDTWDTMNALSEDDGTCPTVFIADPRTKTFDKIAEFYNEIVARQSGVRNFTGADLCSTNPLYNISEYGFCGPIAPLAAGNSYVVVPCPQALTERNIESVYSNDTTNGVDDFRGVYECPDIDMVVAGRSELRRYVGLGPVSWNNTIEQGLLEEVRANVDDVCANPYRSIIFSSESSKSPLAQFVFIISVTSGPTATARCSVGSLNVDITAQTMAEFVSHFDMPDGFYTSDPAREYMYVTLSNTSTSFACALVVCDVFYVSTVCLYDVTWDELNGQAEWYKNIPKNATSCPVPYYPQPGDTYESIAAAHNITVAEVMCWQRQAATPHDGRVRWAYGIAIAIPCPSENPDNVTCPVYELYKDGSCGFNYTAEAGDSFASVAELMRAKQQQLNACEICYYNHMNPECTMELFNEVTIPCRNSISDEMVVACRPLSNKLDVLLAIQITTSETTITADYANGISKSLRSVVLGDAIGAVTINSPSVGSQLTGSSGSPTSVSLPVSATISTDEMNTQQLQDKLDFSELQVQLNSNGLPVDSVSGGIAGLSPTPSPPPSPTPTPVTDGGSGGLSVGAIVGIAVGCSVAVLVGVLAGVFMWKRRRVAATSNIDDKPETQQIDSLRSAQPSSTIDTSNKMKPWNSNTGTGPPLDSIFMSGYVASLATSSQPESTGAASGSSGERSYVIKTDDIVFDCTSDGAFVELGSGAFSKVYRGRMNDEAVAVKVMQHTVEHKDQVQALLREISALRQCRHDNIVEFYGASFTGNDVMIVFELMDEGDLFHLLRRQTANEFLWRNRGHSVALSIATGLAFMHSKRIVHCDLKSPNILLNKNGVPKIGDMGMSKYLTKEYITKGGDIGSFAWAAPELILNSRISEKVDIYSFGVIMWELVTGELPQRGHLREPRVPDECSAEVAALISACRCIDDSARPSAVEVRDRLRDMAPMGLDS